MHAGKWGSAWVGFRDCGLSLKARWMLKWLAGCRRQLVMRTDIHPRKYDPSCHSLSFLVTAHPPLACRGRLPIYLGEWLEEVEGELHTC